MQKNTLKRSFGFVFVDFVSQLKISRRYFFCKYLHAFEKTYKIYIIEARSNLSLDLRNSRVLLVANISHSFIKKLPANVEYQNIIYKLFI